MFFKDDNKKRATIIIKRLKGGMEDMSPSFESMERKSGAEQDSEAGYDQCCEDMMSAMKSGDKSRLKSALKSFVSMLMDEKEDDSEYPKEM